MLWLLSMTSLAWAQVPRRPIRPAPKAAVCALPILPALPTLTDAAFFAKADVPHGKVEQVLNGLEPVSKFADQIHRWIRVPFPLWGLCPRPLGFYAVDANPS